jgi:hypothetical protein
MSGLTVDFLASYRDIPEPLWEACFAPPAEGRWWYAALEDSGLEDQFTFLYALIRQDGQPVGIAPAFVMDVPLELVVPPEILPLFAIPGRFFPKIMFQRTLFLGSPCSDEGRLGLLPGTERRAVLLAVHQAALRQARRMKAPMIVWKDFVDSDTAADFAWLRQHCRLFAMPSFPGTEAAVAGDYYASLKASRRYNLKKKLKRSHAAAELTVEVVQHPGPAAMDAIFALFWQTYEKATTRFELLNRAFFDRLAAVPSSHFILLREAESGTLVAFMLCFDMDGQVINKFIGIDYARPKDWFLYFRLWEEAVIWAQQRGARTIQSGQTGYTPKIEMGHALIPMSNHGRHANRLIHWIYAKVAATISWATLDEDLAVYLKAHPEEGTATEP